MGKITDEAGAVIGSKLCLGFTGNNFEDVMEHAVRHLLPFENLAELTSIERREKTPTPKRRFSIWTLLRTPGPLYYKTPPCVFCHKNVRSKAVFGP